MNAPSRGAASRAALLDALLWTALAIALRAFVLGAIELAFPRFSASVRFSLATAIAFGAVVGFGLANAVPRSILAEGTLSLRSLGGVALSAAAAVLILKGLEVALLQGWPPSESQLRALGRFPAEGSGEAFLRLVVVAPLAEESLFRGVVLTRLRRGIEAAPAVVLSALLFATAHGNLWQGVPAFVAGIWLGLIVVRTRSVSAAVAGHAIVNFAAWAGFGILRTG